MSWKSLSRFIDALEEAGELVRVKEPVSPRLEITEIADRTVKNNGKALLFENTGTDFPVLINAFASERRMSMALGLNDLEEGGRKIGDIVSEMQEARGNLLAKIRALPLLIKASSWMPKTKRGRGACQEVVMTNPDLARLPVLTCWPADGGPFITLPVVNTIDPETGTRNVGMYRMQVFSADTTGMHWHMHKGSAGHFLKYKKLGKRMPVSVILGGDPVYTYAASAPLPENIDEYLFAGFMRGKSVELVNCLTNELKVPADADFVIEGFIDPDEPLAEEGPFGDHTGFYSLKGYFPKFHVTCITHRKNAVYPATIVGIPPMEDGWMGKATERIFRPAIRLAVLPELADMDMPVSGVFHNLTLISIGKSYPGQAMKVMNSMWGAGQMMFNKIMIVLDDKENIHDYFQVARIVSSRVDPARDIHFFKGPVDILDHSSRQYAFGSKMGIDATEKTGEEYVMKAPPGKPFIDKEGIAGEFPEITRLDDSFPGEGISLLMLGIRKTHPGQVKEAGRKLLEKGLVGGFKCMVFMDDSHFMTDAEDTAWLCCNNIDPDRDCFIAGDGTSGGTCLIADATMKNRELDGFDRDWPNVIVMDEETIREVDKKWPGLGLGGLLPSPSLKYRMLVKNPGAIVNQKNLKS
jgi:4-hydroxy-3-polyprenylbenzoate decarboxylase